MQGRIRQNPSNSADFAGSFQMPDEMETETGGEVRFKVSPQQWAYLGWLARNTVLGPNEQAVARQVLAQRLSEMRGERFEDGQRS
jgi:hypothetical protein